jgi:hypothetical protein
MRQFLSTTFIYESCVLVPSMFPFISPKFSCFFIVMFSPKVVVGSSISISLSALVPLDGHSTEVVDVMW